MDKFNASVPSFEFMHTLRGLFTGAVSPDALWRFVLGLTAAAALAIGVFAYLSYTWAGGSETPVIPARSSRDTLSAEELSAVIEIYRTKEATYRALMRTRPVTPNLGIDAGVIVPVETTTGVDASVLEVAPIGTPTTVP